MLSSFLVGLVTTVAAVYACDACNGPLSEVVHERNVRRMQPEASGAATGPKGPLEWGQINFLQTVSSNIVLYT